MAVMAHLTKQHIERQAAAAVLVLLEEIVMWVPVLVALVALVQRQAFQAQA
jgi:hypothetical protein